MKPVPPPTNVFGAFGGRVHAVQESALGHGGRRGCGTYDAGGHDAIDAVGLRRKVSHDPIQSLGVQGGWGFGGARVLPSLTMPEYQTRSALSCELGTRGVPGSAPTMHTGGPGQG